MLDELVFADMGTLEVRETVTAEEACNSNAHGNDFRRIMAILDYGGMLGSDMRDAQVRSAATESTDDALLRTYFHACCVKGESLKRFYFPYLGEVGDDETFPYDSGWDWLCGNKRTQRIPVPMEIDRKASAMAMDACELMGWLDRSEPGRCADDVSLVAQIIMKSPNRRGATPVFIEANFDYVKVCPGRKVFIGAYETLPSYSAAEVRRHAAECHWGARAYLGKLIASAHYGLPVEWNYVVASSKAVDFPLNFKPANQSDYPCRAYGVSEPTLEAGRRSILRGLFRMCYQNLYDAYYLRHETI